MGVPTAISVSVAERNQLAFGMKGQEVEVAPSELGEIVGLARLAAHRAWKQGATLGGDLDVQSVDRRAGVEPLADQLPRLNGPTAGGCVRAFAVGCETDNFPSLAGRA
jgi:hypothetical protein